jgi:Ca2+/H+ antiporter
MIGAKNQKGKADSRKGKKFYLTFLLTAMTISFFSPAATVIESD